MKLIVLSSLLILSGFVRGADRVEESAVTKVGRLLGMELSPKMSDELFTAERIAARLHVVGDRDKIVAWLLNQSDATKISLSIEYLNRKMILSSESVIGEDGQKVDIQLDFDQHYSLANVWFAVTPFRYPLPPADGGDHTPNETFKIPGAAQDSEHTK